MTSTRFTPVLWLAAFSLLGPVIAWAHDPFLSYTNIWLRPNEMEVDCSLARASAARLMMDTPAGPQPPLLLTPDNIDNYLPALKKAGEKLFEVTAGGKLLAPIEVDVELNEEGDGVDFPIVYPRSPATPLRIAATYIKLLPDDGYATALTLFDNDRNVLDSGENLDTNNLGTDLKAPPPSLSPSPKNGSPTTGQQW